MKTDTSSEKSLTPDNSASDDKKSLLITKNLRISELEEAVRSLIAQCRSHIENIDKLVGENKNLKLENESLKKDLEKISNEIDTTLFHHSIYYTNRLNDICQEKIEVEKNLTQLLKKNVKLRSYLTNAQRNLEILQNALTDELMPIAVQFKNEENNKNLYDELVKQLTFIKTRRHYSNEILLQTDENSELRKTISQQRNALEAQKNFGKKILDNDGQKIAWFFFLAALSGLTSMYMISYAIAEKSFKLRKCGMAFLFLSLVFIAIALIFKSRCNNTKINFKELQGNLKQIHNNHKNDSIDLSKPIEIKLISSP